MHTRDTELLDEAYAAFNARDVHRALSLMAPDVEWPNAIEGGAIHGRAAVAAYWARQWRTIDPRVTPTGYTTTPDGHIVADVHQVVRDLAGAVLVDRMVRHEYTFAAGLVRRMVIVP